MEPLTSSTTRTPRASKATLRAALGRREAPQAISIRSVSSNSSPGSKLISASRRSRNSAGTCSDSASGTIDITKALNEGSASTRLGSTNSSVRKPSTCSGLHGGLCSASRAARLDCGPRKRENHAASRKTDRRPAPRRRRARTTAGFPRSDRFRSRPQTPRRAFGRSIPRPPPAPSDVGPAPASRSRWQEGEGQDSRSAPRGGLSWN